ncbi:hypothetical protein BS17DRAFT_772922 [Gyrodon lividus]|nr:hypothetical protein BS17DRAFT_772922 [Gyrodon lividus]
MTGITVLLAIVAPTWWAGIAGTVGTGVGVFHITNSGTQFLEARQRRESRHSA